MIIPGRDIEIDIDIDIDTDVDNADNLREIFSLVALLNIQAIDYVDGLHCLHSTVWTHCPWGNIESPNHSPYVRYLFNQLEWMKRSLD